MFAVKDSIPNGRQHRSGMRFGFWELLASIGHTSASYPIFRYKFAHKRVGLYSVMFLLDEIGKPIIPSDRIGRPDI